MPELPEVEVVRRGLQSHVVGRRIQSAELTGLRVARRHLPGPVDLAARVTGTDVVAARRRGKYLWLALRSGGGVADEALVIHLGMSGQLLVESPDAPREKHCHATFLLSDGQQLRFVDQRTFGGLQLVDAVPDPYAVAGESDPASDIPSVITHIAPDPLEEAFDLEGVVRAMRKRHTQIKRALLDQSLVSGIGNIYADEALWRAKLHGERLTDRTPTARLREVLLRATDVMTESLDKGGTSFDSLYVNVNGASGYFERSLNAYGREGAPCKRCGTPIQREHFMNRSSYFCPRCQRKR